MLSNMASSLILHKRIHTTTAKAKALRIYIDPLITKSKTDTTHSRRIVFSYLQNKEAVTELFREISTKVADRPGGYTRIIKLPNRLGDNAEMCMMELVDYNENLLADKQTKTKSTRRRRGAGAAKKKADDQTTTEAAVAEEAVVAEEVAEEVATEEVIDEVVTEEVVEEKTPEAEVVVEEEKKEEPVAEVKEEEKKKEVPEEKVEEEKPAEEGKKDDSKQDPK